MHDAYKATSNKQEPDVEFEGSDNYFASLRKAFMRGEFPSGSTLDLKAIMAQHTLQGEVTYQEPKSTKEGTEYVKEEANEPWGKEACKRRMNIWRTSLLMASGHCGHPS